MKGYDQLESKGNFSKRNLLKLMDGFSLDNICSAVTYCTLLLCSVIHIITKRTQLYQEVQW